MRKSTLHALVAVLMMAPAAAVLADQPPHCAESRDDGTLGESTYRVVERAIEHLSNDEYAEAERRLRDITGRVQGFERAVVFQTLGFVYAQQERLGEALEAFEVALELDVLARDPQEDLMLNVGQLYVADGQYAEGVAALERYLRETCRTPAAQTRVLLASAYAETGDYRPALKQVDTALAMSGAPREQWLQLKLALHYELREMEQCADTLIELIALVPDNGNYWRQLSGVLMDIENREHALAALAVAERQGMLETERDLINLASIYQMLEVPYKAARLLSRGIDEGRVEGTTANLERLSEAWIAAHEWDRAEQALRAAAREGESGTLWKRLAQVMMEKEDWDEARAALERALQAGVDDEGQTRFLLGVAAYNTGDNAGARSALQAAASHPESREAAQQWLNYLR